MKDAMRMMKLIFWPVTFVVYVWLIAGQLMVAIAEKAYRA